MISREYIRLAWLISFAGWCACFTFAIAYSHILAVAALVFLAADFFGSPDLSITDNEKKLYKLIGAFVVWQAISATLNNTPGSSLATLREEWLFLLIPLSMRAFRNKHWRTFFIFVLIISASIIALYGWSQHLFGVNLRPDYPLTYLSNGQTRAGGAFHNTLTFGNLFAALGVSLLGLGLIVRDTKLRISASLAGAICSGAAVFSYSRGSILALGVGLFALVVLSLRFSRRYSKRLAISVAVVLTLSSVALGPSLVDRFQEAIDVENRETQTLRERSVSRFTIWKTSARIVGDNPLIGVGPGNFYNAYLQSAEPGLVVHYSHAHNDILNIAAYAGIPGALLYIAIWVYLLTLFVKTILGRSFVSQASDPLARGLVVAALVGSVTFMASSLTEATFADEEVRSFLMVLWGIGLWGVDSLSENGTRSELQV